MVKKNVDPTGQLAPIWTDTTTDETEVEAPPPVVEESTDEAVDE